jgi:hypothetical protein
LKNILELDIGLARFLGFGCFVDQRCSDYSVSFGDWVQLTVSERIARCRACADEARRLSESATRQSVRTAYFELSEKWTALAEEIERQEAEHSALV